MSLNSSLKASGQESLRAVYTLYGKWLQIKAASVRVERDCSVCLRSRVPERVRFVVNYSTFLPFLFLFSSNLVSKIPLGVIIRLQGYVK